MALSITRWTLLIYVCSRLSVVALYRNYGKMPSARVPGVHDDRCSVGRTLIRTVCPNDSWFGTSVDRIEDP